MAKLFFYTKELDEQGLLNYLDKFEDHDHFFKLIDSGSIIDYWDTKLSRKIEDYYDAIDELYNLNSEFYGELYLLLAKDYEQKVGTAIKDITATLNGNIPLPPHVTELDCCYYVTEVVLKSVKEKCLRQDPGVKQQ